MDAINVIEIVGKKNTAICYAKVVEEKATEQIRRMCDYDFTEGCKIRIMPDVHAGMGCTIGTTMTIKDKVVPNVVGVDIGCGMYTVKLGHGQLDLPKIDEAAHYVPSGMNIWDRKRQDFDLKRIKCFDRLKGISRIEKSLGTLGGGNHFIEVDQDEDGMNYLVIHSGSRNLGKQVAEYYQQLAIDLNIGIGDYKNAREKLIDDYKKSGRDAEISHALKELEKRHTERVTSIPEDLCYVHGESLENYLHDIEICQEYARISRELMAEAILDFTGIKGMDGFHTIHNYIDTDEMILRKGAIAAHKGEMVLIPLNMRDGSILAVGRGNPEWNYSAPHGAGRIMSRKQAMRSISMDEFRDVMKGIYTTSVSEDTLDEAPMAYKSWNDILDVINESVDVLKHLRPIYNFKASDSGYRKS